MTGPKTNERPGTRATLRGFPMSASKARVVLNLVRGEDVTTAAEILSGTSREAADVIAKILASAVANAVNNDAMNAEELYVSAAFADEGITMKRFSPRARGRAGKIFKRSTHITVIVSRMDEERLELMRNARSAQAVASRSRRVQSSRRRADQQASFNKREAAHEAQAELDAAAEAEANLEVTENEEIENESAENEVVAIEDAGTTPISDYDDDTPDPDVAAEEEGGDTESTENDEPVSNDTTEETN
jgi:large subunit ribosomal protein L22